MSDASREITPDTGPSVAPQEQDIDRLRHELAAAQARYQALVEQIPAILFVDTPTRDGGSTVYVSPQIEQILGVDADEFAADPDVWKRHLHPDDRERVLREYEAMLDADGVHMSDYRMVRPDGRVVWISDRATTSRGPDGTPLLQQGIMFDVSDQKEAEAIVQRQVDHLRMLDVISREFTELVLERTGVGGILAALRRITQGAVVLEDRAHQIVDVAGDHEAGSWTAHSRQGHTDPAPGHVHRDDGSDCSWIDVCVRDERWARLHVIGASPADGTLIELALDRAAAAVALVFLAERDAAQSAEAARSSLLSDLVHGRYASPDEIASRIASLGGAQAMSSVVAIVVETASVGHRDEELERHDRRSAVLRLVREELAGAGIVALAGLVGDRVFTVSDAGPNEEAMLAAIRVVADRVVDRARTAMHEVVVAVGMSEPTQIGSVRWAFETASEYASYGTRLRRSGVYLHGEMGLDSLLLQLADGPQLAAFVEAELAALLAHDATSPSPLLPTLRAYLRHRGRVAPAARELFIDRRSLYHRLDRIEEVSRRKLDPETQLRMELALRGLDVLRGNGRSGGLGAGT